MKKRIIPLCIFLAAVLALCLTAATTAFLTRQTTADNILTFGSLQLALRQTTLNSHGEEVPVAQDSTFDITSHSAVSRILRVENTGEHPMYFRVALHMAGTTADGKTFDTRDLVSYQLNEADWVYRDGWYYYKQILTPHETTNALMTQVIFQDINSITQTYPGSQFDLDVDAQAVQSENNTTDVLSATGWPEP